MKKYEPAYKWVQKEHSAIQGKMIHHYITHNAPSVSDITGGTLSD